MAQVVISLRIMPGGIDTNLELLKEEIWKVIEGFIGNSEIRVEKKPVAFGLNSLNFVFSMDEGKNLEELEEGIKALGDVSSVEVADMRRAIG